MRPLQIAGLVMISAALMFGGVDLFRDVTNSGSDVTVVRLWTMISYRSLSWVQVVIQGYLSGRPSGTRPSPPFCCCRPGCSSASPRVGPSSSGRRKIE